MLARPTEKERERGQWLREVLKIASLAFVACTLVLGLVLQVARVSHQVLEIDGKLKELIETFRAKLSGLRKYAMIEKELARVPGRDSKEHLYY